MKVFIIHGAYGNPQENWIPWLQKELTQQGATVIVPHLPTPHNQHIDSWLRLFSPYEMLIDKDSILIGHSIGATFLLSILERLRAPVRGCILISGFIEPLRIDTFDEINRSFFEKEFDWDRIRANCAHFVIFHGSDDPYVPISACSALARHLCVQPILIENGGHLNAAAGFTQFPQLLTAALSLR